MSTTPSGQPRGGTAANILETVGATPLVRLNRSVQGLAPQVYAKTEYFNPGGSTKTALRST